VTSPGQIAGVLSLLHSSGCDRTCAGGCDDPGQSQHTMMICEVKLAPQQAVEAYRVVRC
jgi:hypothetical protein